MMLRVAGQITGTCFQRCVGMDALITLYSTTWEIDQEMGTNYHKRFKEFLIETQNNDYMTDGFLVSKEQHRQNTMVF
jgi:4-hydroxybutyryl-CoA dehydratase / vinylacetyl-CoA-Delta-isomerase